MANSLRWNPWVNWTCTCVCSNCWTQGMDLNGPSNELIMNIHEAVNESAVCSDLCDLGIWWAEFLRVGMIHLVFPAHLGKSQDEASCWPLKTSLHLFLYHDGSVWHNKWRGIGFYAQSCQWATHSKNVPMVCGWEIIHGQKGVSLTGQRVFLLAPFESSAENAVLW